MSVKLEDNSLGLKARLDMNVSVALRLMLEDTHRLANQITPYQYGTLRTMVRKQMEAPNVGVISWYAPYAGAQERGYTSGPVTHYTTPGTQAWFAKESVEKVNRNARQYFIQAGVIR